MKLERVLIVTENASMQMGGEGSLPLYYFKLMRSRGIRAYIVCHARVREELKRTLAPNEFQDIFFVEDSGLQHSICNAGRLFPPRVQDLILGQLIHLLSQIQIRTLAKRLIQDLDLQIILEPSPITPKGPSFMYDMGVPVVIGPMCGGLEFPPAFRYMDSRFSRLFVQLGRAVSNGLNWLIPGKVNAEALIVANPRTAAALPVGCKGKIYEVIESGVDLDLWFPTVPKDDCTPGNADRPEERPTRFIFSGRFVDWKGIQFLIEAFQQVAQECDAVLELVGDGELRPSLEAYVQDAGIAHAVKFHGWKSRAETAALVRECDVFVMPSLRECGGTAILEAMAMGLPIVATDWAGPAIYVSPECGFKVPAESPKSFTKGLQLAMLSLARSPELRQQMGMAAQYRVKTQYFDWHSKVDRVIEILEETLEDDSEPKSSLDYSNGIVMLTPPETSSKSL
jgi:glycosyltransferase involved in cell wall biosynthesis